MYILGQYIQVMHRSRIPGVESRLGSTWHRLNHNRAIKRPFQQCWTVKPGRIQLVWCKIHQFLLSAWKLTGCFLEVCLLTLSSGRKAAFLSIWVKGLPVPAASWGGIVVVALCWCRLDVWHMGTPLPQPSLTPQCSSQAKTSSAASSTQTSPLL